MKILIVILGLFAAFPAGAQMYQHVYDPSTGNSYTINRQFNGDTQVRGMNMQNGTMWNSTVQPNGNARGFDGSGNSWNYNAQTGFYSNTNGTICTGKGAARFCN